MENLNEALATLINNALAGMDTSIEFLEAEIPDVITQLLMWNMTKSGILFSIGIILWIGFGILIKSIWNKCKNAQGLDSELEGFVPIFLACSFLLSVVSLFTINLTWLQIWIAPKVWLLEYAAQLVK